VTGYSPEGEDCMAVDYSTPAEVYTIPGRGRAMFYRKFPSLAEAVQFVVEGLPKEMRHGLVETESERFEGLSLRALYDAEEYPLPRPASAGLSPATS
jgi:hypothetical protein